MEAVMNVEETMAYLDAPYDPVQIVKDLLEHAVYDYARNDECANAVENALAYLEQEA
jgi:hypothetical protein